MNSRRRMTLPVCEWGACTRRATVTIDYPAKVPGYYQGERCPAAGTEPLHVCRACAPVARAEVKHLLTEHARYCPYCY
jgi:hypothetical protein